MSPLGPPSPRLCAPSAPNSLARGGASAFVALLLATPCAVYAAPSVAPDAGTAWLWGGLLVGTLLGVALSLALARTRRVPPVVSEAPGEGRFRRFFDKNSSVMLLIEPGSGRILDANEAAAHYYGYPRAELTALSINAINTLPPSAVAAERERALQEERNYFNFRHRLASGEVRDVEVYATPIIAEQGQPLLFSIIHDITARLRAEGALNAERLRLGNIIQATRVGTWEWNVQSGAMVINERWAGICGYAPEELAPVDVTTFERCTHPDDLRVVQALLERHFSGELDHYSTEVRMRHKDGHWVWVHTRGQLIERDAQGRPLRMAGTHADISERKAVEARLKLAAGVFTHAREAIIITDPLGTILEVNDAFSTITGYPREEAIGNNPRLLKSGRHDESFYRELWHDLQHKGHWYGEVWNRRKDGTLYPELLTISGVRDEQGQIQHYIALFSDISLQKEQQRQLEHIAHYDALTGMANRVLLSDRMHQAMSQARRREQLVAVAYLDLDGFKQINDQYGHEVGDQLLVSLAAQMHAVLREGDTIARLGGDEFVAVLIDITESTQSVPILARLLESVAQPITHAGLQLKVSASIGVTFYPQGDEEVDADLLLRQADQAMYQAKLAGRNRYHLFDAEQDRYVRGHHESLERIAQALRAGEFVLYYQPKVNMRTGAVVGSEALIRWQHPEKGLLAPGEFLPVVEEHPLAVELGEWVLNEALNQLERWGEMGLQLPVSVNISARHLQQVDFMQGLRNLLAAHPGVSPRKLELEVLETSALEDLAQVSSLIEACGELGVRFALDDFGTGYSSLTYLKRLQADQLKIDQSFVRNMLDDPEDLAILEGVLGLSSAFRRQALAEGVESVEHGRLLLQLGCELAQGYGIARPMPAKEMPDWVRSWQPDPVWRSQPTFSRDDLPLLYAGVEHRAWVRELAGYLRGERIEPPPLASSLCRFGYWLSGPMRARYAGQAAFAQIEQLHRRVHHEGERLVALQRNGQGEEAAQAMVTLQGLRDQLLAELEKLAPQG